MSYRHNFLFFFRGGGGGGRGAGELAFYFKGTLENNSLFLGNKTNVRECLKIILRNKVDHKKIFFAVSLPAHLYSPYPTHFMVLLGNNYLFLVLLLETKSRFFPFSPIHSSVIVKYMPAWLARSYPRSTAVQEVAGSILRSGISSCGNISSYL